MNWKFSIFTATIIYCLVKETDTANILVVTPLPNRSHFKSFQPLWEALVERGHNLTIIAGHKLKENFQQNYTLVDVKPLFGKLKIVFAECRKINIFQGPILYHNVNQDYIEEVFKFSDVQALINSNNEYDLVIAEMFFMDAIFAFGYKFNAPVIAIDPLPAMQPTYNWILGNPFPSSYIPNIFLPYTEKMSLPARIVNTAFDFFSVLFYEFVNLPRSQMQIEKYFNFNKEDVPHIKDIMKNISLTLTNSHYSIGYIKPNLPHVVSVAGIHLTPLTILPENLQRFMDEAEHGVIYLSFGSLIEPDAIEELGKIFIASMENLPQRVIMKWDVNLLPYVPKSFFVQEWIPQAEVLNHPKCRLFITHGGGHSLLESLNASVPVLGIPFFGDQNPNMVKVEYFEIGAVLNIDDISVQLPQKINEVLSNPKYKENIVKRSQLFRERLNKPVETAIYWIDHIIKHKGGSHLRPALTQLSWYQLYSVDVLVIVAAILGVVVKLVAFIIRTIVQKLTSQKSASFFKAKSWPKEKLTNNLKCD